MAKRKSEAKRARVWGVVRETQWGGVECATFQVRQNAVVSGRLYGGRLVRLVELRRGERIVATKKAGGR